MTLHVSSCASEAGLPPDGAPHNIPREQVEEAFGEYPLSSQASPVDTVSARVTTHTAPAVTVSA